MDQSTSDLLTQTSPCTRMGNLMRRYWVPVVACGEIEKPDSPQVRVQILGEKASQTAGLQAANAAEIRHFPSLIMLLRCSADRNYFHENVGLE